MRLPADRRARWKRACAIAVAVAALVVHGPAASRAQTATASPSPAVSPAEQLSPDALRYDLLVARTALQESQPAIYRYRSKAEIDGAFDRAFAALDHPMTRLEFYAVAGEAVAALEDGHTRLALPRAVSDSVAGAPRFPLSLVFSGGRAYVRETGYGIGAGAELTAIDGMPVAEVVARIFRHLAADGGSTAAKYAQLQTGFARDYALFVDRPARFELEVRESGTARRVGVAAVVPPAAQPAAGAERPPLRLEIDGARSTARLTLETFDDDARSAANEPFSRFIDGAFRRIAAARTRDLIIDVRGNDGGAAFGPLVYSYLAERPFRVFARVRAASRDLAFARSFSRLSPEFLQTFSSRLTPLPDGTFAARDGAETPLAEQQPRNPHFGGRVWVLIDGDVFSSAAEFCALVKANGRARFVGSETGGALAGNTSGDVAVLTLPSSGVRLVLPLLEYVSASPGGRALPRGGIVPDVPVVAPLRDVLDGHDTVMRETLALIAARRS
jgi:Peptidase family S41